MNWKENALVASRSLSLIETEQIVAVLNALADEIETQTNYILAENSKDLMLMESSNPLYDRLLLNATRLQGIANDIRQVALLPSPIGRELFQTVRPNGMEIRKISVPFGVIGIIYEARPNVSFDVFSLCFKSGNACVLKGGTDAWHSNFAIVSIIKNVLEKYRINPDSVTLLPAGREATADLLNAINYVDLIIPRGGKGLIDYVRQHSRIPVIETGAGICHTYFDVFGDVEVGKSVVLNAKTRRVSVCNALDCLVVHASRLSDLPALCHPLSEHQVILYADERARKVLAGHYPESLLYPADDSSYGTEFLDYKMSIKTVASLDEAAQHITQFSSKHSECIISKNEDHIQLFTKMVDAACVYANVSTAFTDGAQFGLGAEIGISTQKMHARGPMALEELCSYKWIISGNGQIRV